MWTPANDGLDGSLLTAIVAGSGGLLVRAGLEDGISRSTDGWEDVGASGGCAADGARARIWRRWHDLRGEPGRAWLPAPTRARPGGSVVGRGAHAGSRPAGALLVAAQSDGSLAVSVDSGQTWFERAAPMAGGEALSVAVDGAVWLGMRVGESEVGVWRSADQGVSWQRVLSRSGVSAVAVAVGDGQPYVGVGSRVLHPLRQAEEVVRGERRPIWRGDPLPDDPGTVTVLRCSPDVRRDRCLVAGTSTGRLPLA